MINFVALVHIELLKDRYELFFCFCRPEFSFQSVFMRVINSSKSSIILINFLDQHLDFFIAHGVLGFWGFGVLAGFFVGFSWGFPRFF